MHSLALNAADKSESNNNARVAKAPPKRIIFICNSLGFYEPYFFPKKGDDFATSEYLKDMKVKEKLTVFQNLWHPGMATSNHDSEKSFLTGAPSPEGLSFVNKISLDQVLAQHVGTSTRFPFLAMSLYDRGWGCSWNDRGSAIPPMHAETKIFNKLFGKEDLAARKRQIENDKHVVACLIRDMAHIRKTGKGTGKLSVYQSVIDEMEEQLKRQTFWLGTKKPVVANTLSDDKEFGFSIKVRNMLELAKLALRTDSTRVITFSMDWIYSAIKVPGATGGWHTLSHHGNRPDMIKRLSRIEVDIVKHLNQFLYDLDQIKESNGTLLDNTTVLIGSNFGDASNHTHNNLPTIVAGGGYRHNAHTVLEKPTPLCNLFLELLHHHNIDAGKFGSSTGDMKLLATG